MIKSTFFDMPLSDGMKMTIKNIGYSEPTAIQERSIPELLAGSDVLGQAQTGTGKTAAFSVPLIELINESELHVQALVVCPTRELCLQVCQEIQKLSVHKPGLNTVALYGGQSIEQQFKALKSSKPNIIVATPGRLFDHLRRKTVDLSSVRMIVLDEADEMLDMGFRSEIEQIFELSPTENQRIFFSATMPKAIKDLACNYLRNPKIIKIESKTLTVSTISQSYFRARSKEKADILARMLDIKDPKLAVVFCNTKSSVEEVMDMIEERGFEAAALHGDLSQGQRDRVMTKFRAGLVRVLVATDVAARGLDIEDVEMVVNFHLPHDPEDYVHRIGRTGRAGKKGYAISLVEPRDNSRLRRISQFANIAISESHPPTMAEVKTAKVASLFAKVKNELASKDLEEYRLLLQKQNVNAEDFAAGMLFLALKKFNDSPQELKIIDDLRKRNYSGHSAEARFKKSDKRASARSKQAENGYRHNSMLNSHNNPSRATNKKKKTPAFNPILRQNNRGPTKENGSERNSPRNQKRVNFDTNKWSQSSTKHDDRPSRSFLKTNGTKNSRESDTEIGSTGPRRFEKSKKLGRRGHSRQRKFKP